MSILDKMRSSTDSTFMQIVLVLIIVAMFFWYSPTQGDQSRTVVTVNGTQIRDTEYFPVYRLAYARAQQRGMTAEQEEQLQFEVKQGMARDEVLRQTALAMGFTASDGDVRMVIRNDFRFFNPETNEFDEEIYKDYRRSRSVQELEKGFETTALINKLRWSVMMAADLPEERVKQQYVERETKVELEYVRIDPNDVRDSIEVNSAELGAWTTENGAKIQDRYDKDFKRLYDFPERVSLDLIRLLKEDSGPTDDELTDKLNGIREKITAGESFGDLARKWSEDESALKGGRLAERRMPTLTEDERNALSALAEGEITEVISTERSVFIYQLDKRIPAETIALESVQKDIAMTIIREERAANQADAVAKRIREEWVATGEVPAEMLVELDLKMDQSGLVNKESRRVGGPPAKMVAAGLLAEEGDMLEGVFMESLGGRDVRHIGKVTKTQAADLNQYDENKDRLYESVLFQIRNSMWTMWADEQVSKATIMVH